MAEIHTLAARLDASGYVQGVDTILMNTDRLKTGLRKGWDGVKLGYSGVTDMLGQVEQRIFNLQGLFKSWPANLAKSFWDTGVRFERLEKLLEGVTGSTERMREAMDFSIDLGSKAFGVEAAESVGKASEKAGKAADTFVSYNAALSSNLDCLTRLGAALPDFTWNHDQFVRTVTVLDERLGYINVAADQYGMAVRRTADEGERANSQFEMFVRDAGEAASAVSGYAATVSDSTGKVKKQVEATDSATSGWKRMAGVLENQLSDTFNAVLDNAELSFRGIEDAFKRLLSNMLGESVVSGIRELFTVPEGGKTTTEATWTSIMSQAWGNMRGLWSGWFGGRSKNPYAEIDPGVGPMPESSTSAGSAYGTANYLGLALSMLQSGQSFSKGNNALGWHQFGTGAAYMIPYAGQFLGPILSSDKIPWFNSKDIAKRAESPWFRALEGPVAGGFATMGEPIGMALNFWDPGGFFSNLYGASPEAPNLQVGFREGAGGRTWFESARHMSQSGEDWTSAQNTDFIKSIRSFFDGVGGEMKKSFTELMADHEGWSFQTEDVETVQDAFTDVAANIIMDFADELFGPDSIFATTSRETFGHMAKEGEDWRDVVVRLAQAIGTARESMEDLEEASLAISGEDPYGVQAFQNQMADTGESISLLWEKFGETNDPSEQIDYLNQIKALVVDRYESEKAFVEGLRDELEALNAAQYEFTTRLQAKIDSLTGSSETFGIVWNHTVDAWNAFQNEADPARKLELLGQVETGLDEALAMQTALYEAEISRLQGVLAYLNQLRDLSADIGSTLAGLSGDYSNQIGYAFSRAQAAWNAGLALEPDDIEGRAQALQDAYAYLQQAYNAAVSSINAGYDAQIEALQTENETLQSNRGEIQNRINALNTEKSALEESYRTQIDAIEAQIAAAEEWKRLSESIADQILDMKLNWDNQQDIEERIDIARAEIARVQSLYAGATGDEKIQYAGQLQNLYGDLLNLGQEAWQRPSPEYQELYQEVLSGLEALQSDADANASDTAALQEELNALNAAQVEALNAIDLQITAQEGLLDSIDQRIEANNTEIARLDTERNQALTDLNTQYAGYLQTIKDEADRLDRDYRDPTVEALKAAETSLGLIQEQAATYYGMIMTAGSEVYEAQASAVSKALNVYLGSNSPINDYLRTLKDTALTDLANLSGIMAGIANFLGASYADGGVAVTPQIARIAEKGPEVVLPLSLLSNGGSAGPSVHIAKDAVNLHFSIHVTGDTDPEAVGRKVASVAKRVLGNEITDIVVEGVKRGRIGKTIRDELRHWK